MPHRPDLAPRKKVQRVFFPTCLVVSRPPYSADEVLRLVASQDQGSKHPLAAAIATSAREKGLPLDRAQKFESATGIGVRGLVAGRQLAPGNSALMQTD